MPRFKFKEIKASGVTFLVYQSGQPGGLPLTKDDLRNCYDNFCATTPDVCPSFGVMFRILLKSGTIGININDQLYYSTRVAVDHSLAERARASKLYCDLCHLLCKSTIDLESHLGGRPHQLMTRVRELNYNIQESERDRDGISISPIDFGTMFVGMLSTKIITVRNSGASPKTLEACEFVRKVSNFRLYDPHGVTAFGNLRRACIIYPGNFYNISLTCHATTLGYIRDILIFKFRDFKITRHIAVLVDGPDSALIAPKAPYQRPPPVPREAPLIVVPGEPLPLPPAKNVHKTIDQYPVPDKLRGDIDRENPHIEELGIGRDGRSNYIAVFSTLLFIEEIKMELDIRQYDTTRELAPLSSGSYHLEVPGLAENRPSVLKGDAVFVRVENLEYEGIVHQVHRDGVNLRFDAKFNRVFNEEQAYKIRFSFNRISLRRMHEAVSHSGDEVLRLLLFPQDTLSSLATNTAIKDILRESQSIRPINRYLNQQQMNAVAAILLGSSRPSPYLVFGPPGTGKTMTIVEAMGQLYRNLNQEVRILACAPSNNAADLIAQRLLSKGVQKREIYRFNAFNRNPEDLPEEISGISSYNAEAGTFEELPLREIEAKKIVVSTCVSAGKFYSMGIKPFTHIFIDEAGQAMEPESLIALVSLTRASTTVVLAGDPKQLGPVIRSQFAEPSRGNQPPVRLGRSLLERIISTPPYRRDPINYAAYGNYNVRLITKLVNNYRSHPEILTVPNKLFYDNELLPMADLVRRTALCHWEGLPTKGFPMIFHGIVGKDEREENSPSWFNRSEALQVSAYVKQLLELRNPKLTAPEIGVISPYRKQAEKMRTLLRAKGYGGVTVGSVEQFQGQERLIIIVSCVRSNSEFVEVDYQHNLGFLKNPKRFNVAITRPQALLIVIGNPRVLAADQHWAALLWYIVDHGGYTGCDKPPRSPTDSMEQITDVFDRLRIGGEDPAGMDAEDLEWRPYQ